MHRNLLFRLFLYTAFVWCSQAGRLAKTLLEVSNHFDRLSPAEHLTDVGVGIYFDHLYSVDDRANRFTSDFYLSYQWFDPRWSTLDWTHDFIEKNLTEQEAAQCSSSGNGGHRRLSIAQSGGTMRHFLELGHDEIKLVWVPDLHLRNLYKSEMRLHSEMMRIYPDGRFELISYVWAVLEMQDPEYSLYPYDEQELNILVESFSHTNSRITMHPLHDLTGLEVSLTHHWPGWSYEWHHEDKYDVEPEYAHSNDCRTERKARIKFNIHVKRAFSPLTLLPVLLLVVTSWAGFFIKVQALMPRVATGFLSYLTINNIAQARLAAIPDVNYAVWYSVLMETCRYGVFLSVLETVAAQFLYDKVSARVATSLDIWARFVVPGDFFLMLIVMLNVHDTDGIQFLTYLSKVNLLVVIVATAIFVKTSHRVIVRKLRTSPLEVYGDGHPPLDIHDCRQIFSAMACHHNADHVVDASEIAEYLIAHAPLLPQDHLKDKMCVFQDRLEKKIGNSALTVEQFVLHQQTIFIELRQFIHSDLAPRVDKKTNVNPESPPEPQPKIEKDDGQGEDDDGEGEEDDGQGEVEGFARAAGSVDQPMQPALSLTAHFEQLTEALGGLQQELRTHRAAARAAPERI